MNTTTLIEQKDFSNLSYDLSSRYIVKDTSKGAEKVYELIIFVAGEVYTKTHLTATPKHEHAKDENFRLFNKKLPSL
jgi:uncharacterized protein with PhoU and TrkA domain